MRARRPPDPAQTKTENRLFGRTAGGLVGFFFFAVGAFLFFESAQFAAKSTSATGTVVKIDTYRDSDGDRTYRATVRYRTAAGQVVDAQTHNKSSSYNYAVGERVDILYAPEDPTTVRVDSVYQTFLIGILITAIGGFLTLAAIYRLPTSISYEFDSDTGKFRWIKGGQFSRSDAGPDELDSDGPETGKRE